MKLNDINETFVNENSEFPEVGDMIRTANSDMEGKIEKVEGDLAFFRIKDGRLMKTPISNVTVIQKLADEDVLDEADPNDFRKILNKQHKGNVATVEKQYNGWIIRYKTGTIPTPWMAWHSSKDASTAHRGQSDNPEMAFADAVDWIDAGAGNKKELASRSVIDFNAAFYDNYVTPGKPFYAKVDDGYLLLSQEPMPEFKKGSLRFSDRQNFYSIPLASEAEAKASGLVPNGRYILGKPEEMQPGVMMFPLHFQNVVTSKSDRLYMKEPGFTVGTTRKSETIEDILAEVTSMWESEKLTELSVDKMNSYIAKAKSTDNFRQGRSLGKIAKTAATGVPTAVDKINAKTGNRTGSAPKQGPIRQGPQSKVKETNMPVEEPNNANKVQSTTNTIDPWNGIPKKLAKAPKGSMQGSEAATFDEMVKDTINTHGVKWAFEYYVKKHGLSPRQFAIYAGLNSKPAVKNKVKGDWTDPSITTKPKKKGWWARMRGKLPFEE